jgi:hypothetical protein
MTKPICGSAIVARPRRRKSAQTAIALGRGHHCDAGGPAAQDLVTKWKANATDITISGQSSEGAIVGRRDGRLRPAGAACSTSRSRICDRQIDAADDVEDRRRKRRAAASRAQAQYHAQPVAKARWVADDFQELTIFPKPTQTSSWKS